MATATASDPSRMRYQAPDWASVCWMTVKIAVPTTGPSMLPTPPISATKIIFADHPTLKIALARTLSWLTISSAPPAPHPAAGEEQVGGEQSRGGHGERAPVGQRLTEHRVDQRQPGETGSGSAAERAEADPDEAEDLGHHPGADREVLRSQAEDEKGYRHRDRARDDNREGDRQIGVD